MEFFASETEDVILSSKIFPSNFGDIRIVHRRQLYRVLDTWLFAGYTCIQEILTFEDKIRLFAYGFSSHFSLVTEPNIVRLREFLNTNLPICQVLNRECWVPFRIPIFELAIESERGSQWAQMNEFRLPEKYNHTLNSDKIRTYYNQQFIEQKQFLSLIRLQDQQINAILGLKYNAEHMLNIVDLVHVIIAYDSYPNFNLVTKFLSQLFCNVTSTARDILRCGEAGRKFFFAFQDKIGYYSLSWFIAFTLNSVKEPWDLLDKVAEDIYWPSVRPTLLLSRIPAKFFERYKAPQAYACLGDKLTEEILISYLLKGYPLFQCDIGGKYSKLLQTENVRRVLSYLGLLNEQFTWSLQHLQLLGPKFNVIMTTLCLLRQSEQTVWSLISNELLFTILHFAV